MLIKYDQNNINVSTGGTPRDNYKGGKKNKTCHLRHHCGIGVRRSLWFSTQVKFLGTNQHWGKSSLQKLGRWGFPRKIMARTGAGIPTSDAVPAQKSEATNTSHPTSHENATEHRQTYTQCSEDSVLKMNETAISSPQLVSRVGEPRLTKTLFCLPALPTTGNNRQ